MRVYISGPITGVPDYNENFIQAERKLLAAGHDPVIPVTIGAALSARLGREPTWREYMREDIKALCDCDAIIMLDGWEKSSGARLEEHIAMRLDIKQITLERG